VSNGKNGTPAPTSTRSQGDHFRGGYAAGKVTSGSMKPPPRSITQPKSSSKTVSK
jgi:hypothetical protein